MSLSKRLVSGATAVALVMGVMLVGGASPAGAVVTESTQWIWCEPTPLGVQKQAVPTVLDYPASVSAGQTFDVKVSTDLPSIVLDGFVIFESSTLWQMPEQVTLNSVTFEGGNSGKPEWNGPPNPPQAPPLPPYSRDHPAYPNPNNTETSEWVTTDTLNPTVEEILDVDPWFLGATAEENPYPAGREPGTPSQFGPIPAAVPEGWESDGNTVLVHSVPLEGLTAAMNDPEGPKGFAGRPKPQSVIFNVTADADLENEWIEWSASVASHSIAYAANFNLSTNTQCLPNYCVPGVNPQECSAIPVPGQPLSQQKMTARYILGKTGVGDPTADFLDVPRWHTFYPDIFWMADEGISEGYPVPGGSDYRPQAPLARQGMSAFLYRLANGDAPPPNCTEQPFIDVPVDHPFCPEITWMADEGISTGWDTPAGKEYRPTIALTRQGMSAFLYRMAEGDTPPPSCTPQEFVDVPPSNQFCGEINWMAQEGISEGFDTPDGKLYRPGNILNRQGMSAFLFRFSELG